MFCSQLRRVMLDFILREMPPEEFEEAMEHVALCEGCAQALQSLRKRCGIFANDYIARIVVRAPEREQYSDIAEESPVVRIANAIISQAINEDADLIQIEPMALGVRVRYRVDRQLRDIMRLPSDLHAPLIARIKSLVCVGDDPSSRLGRALVKYGDREIDLTLSAYPTSRGERLVMRLTPHTDS